MRIGPHRKARSGQRDSSLSETPTLFPKVPHSLESRDKESKRTKDDSNALVSKDGPNTPVHVRTRDPLVEIPRVAETIGARRHTSQRARSQALLKRGQHSVFFKYAFWSERRLVWRVPVRARTNASSREGVRERERERERGRGYSEARSGHSRDRGSIGNTKETRDLRYEFIKKTEYRHRCGRLVAFLRRRVSDPRLGCKEKREKKREKEEKMRERKMRERKKSRAETGSALVRGSARGLRRDHGQSAADTREVFPQRNRR